MRWISRLLRLKGERRGLFESAISRALNVSGQQRIRIQISEALLASELDLVKLQDARHALIAAVDERLESMRQAALALTPEQRAVLARHVLSAR